MNTKKRILLDPKKLMGVGPSKATQADERTLSRKNALKVMIGQVKVGVVFRAAA
jgi:hypothetical protein